MADGERVRIEIGFDGSAVVGGQAPIADVDALQRKLEAGGDGTVQLALDDATMVVVCARVLYLKRFAREARVGFGG